MRDHARAHSPTAAAFVVLALFVLVLHSARLVLADEPFRLTYLRLTGINASLLANNMLPPELVSALDVKGYHIVQTDALVEARHMLGHAGVSSTVLGSDPLLYPESALSEKYFDRAGTLKMLTGRDVNLFPPRYSDWRHVKLPDIDAYRSIVQQEVFPSDYMIYYHTGDVVRASGHSLRIGNPYLWRFLTQSDLDNYDARKRRVDEVKPSRPDAAPWLLFDEQGDDGAMVKLLRYVARGGLPTDFVLLHGTPVYGGCGYDGIQFAAAIPAPRFLTLVMQNTTGTPIDINAFRFTKAGSRQLRPPEVTTAELGASEEQEAALFPQKKLLPGEAIVFPLHIYMTQTEDDRQICLGDEDVDVLEVLPITEMPAVVYLGEARDEEGQLSDERALRVKGESLPPPQRCPKPMTYDYGPATRLKSVNVGGTWYPIRRFDSTLVTMLASSESGSCPHLFVLDEGRGEYINKGEVLVNADGRLKERRERVEIMGGASSVRIWELGNETAFIDYLALVVLDDGGHEQTIAAPDELLIHGDGNYVSLDKGDKLDVQFAEGLSKRGRRFLEIEGYFVPYEHDKPGGVSARSK